MIFQTGGSDYKPTKRIDFQWNSFRRGLNLLLRENEIDKEELAQADNLLLIGKGIPTKRWGTALYYQAGNATGSTRGLKGFYKSNGTNELLSLTDDGYLTKKSNASYSTLTGASWASGNNAYMAQLADTMYIVNGQRELAKYSSPTLVGFPTISKPIITGASNLSNASGTTTKGYRVSAISQVGETLASSTFELANQPVNLGNPAGGVIRLTWTGVSTASGILQGFNIYGRDTGYERFLAGVAASATSFNDDGSSIPMEFTFPPTGDSTGGPIAKYIIRHEDRLIFAGISGEPSKVLISGRAPNQEKFDLSFGGNFIEIEKDAGDDIVWIQSFQGRIIVFKQRSIWQITLGSEQIGNFFITTPALKLITSSYGCIAPRSVIAVENDLIFLSRDAVNTLGNQAGFTFDVFRVNGISIKVRPFFDNISITQKQNAVATYFKKKYILAFPGLDKSMVLDMERQAWIGPWSRDAQVFEVYYDSDSNEHLLYGNDDSVNIDEYSETFTTDKGTAIQTTLQTRQEDFGDWSLFKNIKSIFTQFRNITGEVNVDIRLEQRSGSVISGKNFDVTPATGNSGWGADLWGAALWGSSLVGGGGVDTQQTIRWRELNKIARTLQITVRTTGATDNYELLGIRGEASPVGSGVRPSNWKL